MTGADRSAGGDGPLQGVRVLDIATVYAAPFAAAVLGDLGADVVKVELPGMGDPLRALDPFEGDDSLVWAAVSRNKRCVTLDLHEQQGQDLLLRMLTERDVLFENFRPGTLDRWDLGIDRLRAANSDLIVVRVSGYGQTGPYHSHVGFGTPATAFSGYAYVSGYPDQPPALPPISLADYTAGMFAAVGAISSLYHRDARGGTGQEVDVALYEAMFRLMETVVAPYDRLGMIRERAGDQLGNSAPAGLFQSRGGDWMVLTTSTERTFRRLAHMIGRADMVLDDRFATNRQRVRHRDDVNAAVAGWFSQRSSTDIQKECDANGVPVSQVLNIADIFKEPQYAAREMIVEVDHPSLGSVRLPGVVPKFSHTPGAVRSTGPGLGQHNREVYGELGLSADEITTLTRRGVI